MVEIRQIRQQFWIAVGLITAMCADILLIPATLRGGQAATFWSTVTAVVFWLLALSGYGFIFAAHRGRRRFLSKQFGRNVQKFRPGILCFFANPLAAAADILMIVTVPLLVIVMFSSLQDTYFSVILLSTVIWAVHMHCLFNSRTFRITKYKNKRGSAL